MSKKITGQNAGTSQEEANGAAGGNAAGAAGSGQSVEELLEADADGVDDDGADTTDDGDGDGDGNGNDVEAIVRKTLEAMLPTIQDSTTREIDRRLNSALKKVRGNGKQSKDDDGDGDGENDNAPRQATADVRGARIAFREYLPEKIRFLSPEEKAMATEFGLVQIKAAAAAGFDDEDEAGRTVAEATAKFIKNARAYYSNRTKKALEKQGAIRKDGTSQQSYSSAPPGSVQTAFDRAEKKNRELFPERYAHENKK